MDELFLLTQNNWKFKECSAICLTETWLDEGIPDAVVTPPGFTSHRADRSANLSLKSKGGGVCFLINDRWCINSTTVTQFCSPDLELLNVTCRPIYLPREFASVVLIGVYIPPQANANIATGELAPTTDL